MAKHYELGLKGEELAATYLKDAGFELIGQRVRIEKTDIDLVARRSGKLHFIEVKTRSHAHDDGDIRPEAAVSQAKIVRMERAAEQYLLQNDLEAELSVDLLAIVLVEGAIRYRFYEQIGR